MQIASEDEDVACVIQSQSRRHDSTVKRENDEDGKVHAQRAIREHGPFAFWHTMRTRSRSSVSNPCACTVSPAPDSSGVGGRGGQAIDLSAHSSSTSSSCRSTPVRARLDVLLEAQVPRRGNWRAGGPGPRASRWLKVDLRMCQGAREVRRPVLQLRESAMLLVCPEQCLHARPSLSRWGGPLAPPLPGSARCRAGLCAPRWSGS